ncbi:hypothetical protein [Bradyrhizobium sp. WD16]|nr:hypothetical protein [Bradyrhizobium sp. WD16]
MSKTIKASRPTPFLPLALFCLIDLVLSLAMIPGSAGAAFAWL